MKKLKIIVTITGKSLEIWEILAKILANFENFYEILNLES